MALGNSTGRSAKTKLKTIVNHVKFLFMDIKKITLVVSIIAAAAPVVLQVLENHKDKEGKKDS